MKKFTVLALICLSLIACAGNSNRVNFNSMTDLEIISYNRTVERSDLVYCDYQVRAGTHIKKRYCATLAQIKSDAIANAAQIYTGSSGGSLLIEVQ